MTLLKQGHHARFLRWGNVGADKLFITAGNFFSILFPKSTLVSYLTCPPGRVKEPRILRYTCSRSHSLGFTTAEALPLLLLSALAFHEEVDFGAVVWFDLDQLPSLCVPVVLLKVRKTTFGLVGLPLLFDHSVHLLLHLSIF